MIIRVLPQLETRAEWLAFCRRESPYCMVDAPPCLVDFQTHFLQLTLFTDKDPVRYTLGSRRSIDPAWQLIKRCNWSLKAMLEGLETLDFGSNVRDNELLGVHTDLSARRSFPRDPHLNAPDCSHLLTPLPHFPAHWDEHTLQRLLISGQFRDWRLEQDTIELSPRSLLVELVEHPRIWSAQLTGPRLQVLYKHRALIASCIPDLSMSNEEPPKGLPRLL
ncbi:hypothetical protein [Marinobacterium stanieri]|uniref:hypothetical protein n=1 Tax=Marinobacterium stanieri TaxID=49186 RepID=UPI003A90ED7B